MSTALVKKCPWDVSELKQRRSREQLKLQTLLNKVNRKLDKVGPEGVDTQGDGTVAAVRAAIHVSHGVLVRPYYLLQPKAKGGPPADCNA